MDTFAHAIWAYIIFQRTESVILAMLFCTLPDIMSWGLWILWPYKNGVKWKNRDTYKLPKWLHFLYGITHSIFTVAAVFAAVFLITKKIPVYLWAWPMHILMDIPVHSREWFPTPFLWPISNWRFPGISWGNKWFMITNYTAIIIVSAMMFL
ncbi:MAG: hypothetical protein KKF89_06460 [Nanoarchaeota archaeon]|nr:hypothetical protein [Nanoarchaeota archaeon]MBU1855341.1 hypothetical protein [Nanoarchaeota archaeon]